MSIKECLDLPCWLPWTLSTPWWFCLLCACLFPLCLSLPAVLCMCGEVLPERKSQLGTRQAAAWLSAAPAWLPSGGGDGTIFPGHSTPGPSEQQLFLISLCHLEMEIFPTPSLCLFCKWVAIIPAEWLERISSASSAAWSLNACRRQSW